VRNALKVITLKIYFRYTLEATRERKMAKRSGIISSAFYVTHRGIFTWKALSAVIFNQIMEQAQRKNLHALGAKKRM